MAGTEELVDSDREISIDFCQFYSVLPAMNLHFTKVTALGMKVSAGQCITGL